MKKLFAALLAATAAVACAQELAKLPVREVTTVMRSLDGPNGPFMWMNGDVGVLDVTIRLGHAKLEGGGHLVFGLGTYDGERVNGSGWIVGEATACPGGTRIIPEHYFGDSNSVFYDQCSRPMDVDATYRIIGTLKGYTVYENTGAVFASFKHRRALLGTGFFVIPIPSTPQNSTRPAYLDIKVGRR